MLRGTFVVVVIFGVSGALVGWLRGVQQADPAYTPRISARTWSGGGPAVAIDDAHWNVHTATRGYAPFAKLLASDGYSIISSGNVASAQVLDNARVVVIANALGFRGVVRQLGQVAGVNLDALAADAFSDVEADRLESWVRDGGSLLLVADHVPAGRAVRSLAERFGVTMHDGFVFDPEHSEPDSPSLLVFARASRTLAPHPIIDGRSRGDAVDRVVTFTGQALEGPPHATKLLMFSGTAYQTTTPNAGPEDRVSVAGLGQALAMTHGNGRLVVVGESAMLTSQVTSGGGETERIGLTWPNADNERFARHVMQWLSRAVH
jgi:hypothetical protein